MSRLVPWLTHIASVAALSLTLSNAFAQGDLIDVTASFSSARSGLVFNRATNTFDSMLTLKHIGSMPVQGKLRILVLNTAPVSLANRTGLADGNPYIDVPLLDGYALPQETFTRKLAFSNPTRAPFLFSLAILAEARPPPVQLKILEPETNALLSNPRVAVMGTLSAPENTGVSVNDVGACVFDGRFFANNATLTYSSGNFTARATSLRGAVAEDAVNVTPGFELNGLQVVADSPCGGVAPHQAVFNPSLRDVNVAAVESITADLDGDGSIDYTSGDPTQPIRFTYANPGLYRAHFVLNEKDGTQRQVSHFVAVQEQAQAQVPFRDLIRGLRTALGVGNLPHAASYFSGNARSGYLALLEQVKSQLPAILAGWSDMQPIFISEQLAVFTITRPLTGTPFVFRIVFVKDANGLWKIDSL